MISALESLLTSTKLWEGNVFIGVCLSTGWYPWYPVLSREADRVPRGRASRVVGYPGVDIKG